MRGHAVLSPHRECGRVDQQVVGEHEDVGQGGQRDADGLERRIVGASVFSSAVACSNSVSYLVLHGSVCNE